MAPKPNEIKKKKKIQPVCRINFAIGSKSRNEEGWAMWLQFYTLFSLQNFRTPYRHIINIFLRFNCLVVLIGDGINN